MLDCSEFVNSDEFAKSLSPFHPENASIQASRYMLLKIRYLLKKRSDFAVETTLATRTLLKTVRMAQAAGYSVTLLYFWLNSPELAIERVKARVEAGGHNIPEETVRRRYHVGIDYFFHLYLLPILCGSALPLEDFHLIVYSTHFFVQMFLLYYVFDSR